MPTWWADVTEGYLRSLQRRQRRPNTIATYLYELRGLGAWLDSQGVGSLNEITIELIEGWQDHMHDRALKPSTQLVATIAARGLLRWAAKRDLVPRHPRLWRRLELPVVPDLDPRPIPRDALARIVAAFARPDGDLWWLRTRALFWVLYSSGARISEALSLARGAISEEGMPVIQKGGRPHLLVINRTAKEALADYEAARTDDGMAMFIDLRPRRLGRALSKAEAQKAWDELCERLGIPRFTSHRIRHSCATSLRRGGADLVLIQKQLGHRSLRMVLRYTEVEVDDRQQAVELLNPPRSKGGFGDERPAA